MSNLLLLHTENKLKLEDRGQRTEVRSWKFEDVKISKQNLHNFMILLQI